MPQGRRKVPFSGKAKKLQLKSKKQRKGLPFLQRTSDDEDDTKVDVLNKQPHGGGGRNPNRYALQFHHESEAEIRKRKEEALHTLSSVPENELEINSSDCYPAELDFPQRPPWSFEMSREQLEAKENRYFTEYVSKIEKTFPSGEIGYFELNLETWRQLWRVLEMSDIVLFIVDIRYAGLMFPPSLYNYVTKSLNKEMILVLNKIDLAPAPLVVAWMYHFREKYPSLKIITFTSYPSYNFRNSEKKSSGLQTRLRRGRMRMAAEGALKLLEACKEIVGEQVDLTSWRSKISEEMQTECDSDELEVEETVSAHVDTSFFEHIKYQDGALTIGCLGQPNVGKSSLMNSIMGKKVVSVSRTPGHTKHFQTIYLTKNVRLCDCPGLVFPSKVTKPLQVLMGSFPIAQLREPFSSIRFLAQRLNLPHLLHVSHPEGESEWSAMDICEAWAVKRGFFTARAARPDIHRAANNLLRMALEGKICLCLYPPGYSSSKDFWNNHEDVTTITWIQAKNKEEGDLEKCDTTSEECDEEIDDSAKESGTDSEVSEEEETNPIVCGNKFTALNIKD